MKNIEEIKQSVRDNLEITVVNPQKTGGQQCGIMPSKVRLYSDELSLVIESGHYRSQHKNRELVSVLFELALDDIVF